MNALADRFEALRPRLLRLAYSTLGSVAEAEDVVQEAWLRLERVDAGAIEDLQAWLSTVVGRLALDALGSPARGASATSARGCRTRSSRPPRAAAPTGPTRPTA